MPGPTLSLSETLALDSAIAAITAAQAERERPTRVPVDDAAGITALGVQEAIVTAAGPAGFRFEVLETNSPDGFGWVLEVELRRAGVRWLMAHQVGPEPCRSHDWIELPESLE